ncbi:AAA family ATPase [Actinomadura bangladeshensis]|uniref:AAA domain-containing protein n=1 Tax=Actinomadura bangladeshensis TaxID=453573 RepID=A0A6L9QW84_9ACTN|nr:MoxR family ATPase [Actinomadura bangladeshensis]NEA28833.1 AAA domain-containing protein [Actinomadura bangladeshensis]
MPKWHLYTGDSEPYDFEPPETPSWRCFDGEVVTEPPQIHADPVEGATFRVTPDTVDAVNAALHLRRPLLLTGRPGSGKSSLIDSVARELRLGPVLRWHVTSRSTLQDALYRYDAIGRLHEHNLEQRIPSITKYLRLGPLGTALLPSRRPRALLIDEIDKSDIDLPNDLLNVFERGEYEIPELARLNEQKVPIREEGSDRTHPITRGRVRCHEFPFVVLTSNGERDFPPAFLRRCIRHQMPDPTAQLLRDIVTAHLGPEAAAYGDELITDFANRAAATRAQATDQLLNAVYLVTRDLAPEDGDRDRVVELLLKRLGPDPA